MAEGTTKRQTSTGICSFCKGEFGKGQMTQHLKSCKQRIAQNNLEAESGTKTSKARKSRLLHVLVEGYYRPMYWLHLEMPNSTTLRTLDNLLRGIWLECCGHLSAFRIGNVSYMSQTDDGFYSMGPKFAVEPVIEPEQEAINRLAAMFEGKEILPQVIQLIESWKSYTPRALPQERSMDVKLSEILSVGTKFSYEYDFGSTTELKLKVVAEREEEARRGKKTIQILARNVPPVIICDLCGKSAAYIAGEGYYEEGGVNAVCEECSSKQPGDEAEAKEVDKVDEADRDDEMDEDEYYGGYDTYREGMLPVVNSPRMGMCGYTG